MLTYTIWKFKFQAPQFPNGLQKWFILGLDGLSEQCIYNLVCNGW